MYIQTQETPNPSTLKFIPGVTVMEVGTAAYAKESECKDSPLAKELFKSKYVKGVFLGSDFITITKSDDIEWDMLKTEILGIIMDHIVAGGEIYRNLDKTSKSTKKSVTSSKKDSEVIEQIKGLIQERVRPAVAMDGGDIIFHKYEKGIVYLTMHGACSGCPSSSVTLKQGIESMLKHYIPEIKAVEAVE